VPWRKNAFGSPGERGLRFVERLLSAAQTLRLQKRPGLEFLVQALVSRRAGLPTPQSYQPGDRLLFAKAGIPWGLDNEVAYHTT
jgi:hypothetical protein